MNWRFWKRESAAEVIRREIETLRKSNTNAQARIMALEKENAEAWEVLAFLWSEQESPDTAFFARLRFMLSPLSDKLKRITEMRKEERR
jgi:hypothetical protein